MTKKGREFNEIYDLTAMRVIVGSVKDCYGAIGVIHSLWKPLPGALQGLGRHAQVQHVPGAAHHGDRARGRPLEIQIRTMEMHRTAEYGVAAHWIYKEDGSKPVAEKVEWLRHLLDWQKDAKDPQEFAETLKADLFEDEVFVFTPKRRGEVARRGRNAARLRLLDPHRRRPPLRGRQGQRQDRAAALRAAVGRHLRGADLEEGARPVVATGSRWRRPRAPSRRSAPGSSASAARTPSAPAARSSTRTSSARACRRRRSPARRCSRT